MAKLEYSDALYSNMITALIGDIYYSDSSYKMKIVALRQIAETIVRRLIKHPPKAKLELGDERTIKQLHSAGVDEKFFWKAYRKLKNDANDASHTQVFVLPTEDDFNAVCDAVLTLYSYLFFDYFKKNEFGSNLEIVSSFSLLPPGIRFYVLKELVASGHTNLSIIDKLRLASVKSLGVDGAMKWLEENKDDFAAMPMPYSSKDLKTRIAIFGFENLQAIMAEMNETVFDFLSREIPKLSRFEPSSLPYTTFEEAKSYYEEHGSVLGQADDVQEYNLLMKFIYTGRKTV